MKDFEPIGNKFDHKPDASLADFVRTYKTNLTLLANDLALTGFWSTLEIVKIVNGGAPYEHVLTSMIIALYAYKVRNGVRIIDLKIQGK